MRGRLQGIFASVFGIASVIGPSAGSHIVQAINWRWVFYINLPLGVVSLILIYLGLRETRDPNARPVVDWLGISTLTAWILLLMLGFLNGGSTYPWYSWQETALFASSAALFVVFLIIERRAPEPVIPLTMFRIRTVSSASAVSFLRGISFYSVIAFIPLFEQAGLGGSIDDGRNILYAFLLPLVVGAIIGGQLSTRVGYRGVTFGGLVLMSAGLFPLTTLASSTHAVQIMEYVAVMGFGLGITFPAVVLAVQYSVQRKQIGIASSLAQFMGNLGGTIGLAILGTIQVNFFGSKLNDLLLGIKEPFRDLARPALGDPNLIGRILATPEVLAQVIRTRPVVGQFVPALRDAFAQSVVPVFWAGFIISVGAIFASLLITGSLKQQIATRNAMAAGPDRKDEVKGPTRPLVA
jgi:MFS family permease